MFKFLHSADIHLDSPLYRLGDYEGAPVEEVRRASRRALENLVKLAIEQHVAFVLIAGDLYDGDWKDYNTGLYFISQMSKLREAGIPVYVVAGNHDAASKITKCLRLPENVFLFAAEEAQTFKLDAEGVAIHGQSFNSPAVRKNIAATYPMPVQGYFNIGVLHTCATGREGHEGYAPCGIEDFQSKGYDYWALGHVHQNEILLQAPFTVFSGNIQGRHIRESGPKGCMVVTVDDRGRVSPEFVALDVVRWFRVEIESSDIAQGYDVLKFVGARLKDLLEQNPTLPLLIRIELKGACPAHEELASDPEHWENEIRSVALDISAGRIWIEKVKLHTTKPIDMESSSGPLAEINQYLDELQLSPDRLASIASVVDDLIKQLPRELKSGEEGFEQGDRIWLTKTMELVRPMLIRRLTKGGFR
jgi:DNA repair exonuclease SbcCD nuclease subunit